MFKKNMKKGLSVLLALAMVVTSVTVSGKPAKAETEPSFATVTTAKPKVDGTRFVDSAMDSQTLVISGEVSVTEAGTEAGAEVDEENGVVGYAVYYTPDNFATWLNPSEEGFADGKGKMEIEKETTSDGDKYTYTKEISLAPWKEGGCGAGQYFIDVYYYEDENAYQAGIESAASAKDGNGTFTILAGAAWTLNGLAGGTKTVAYGTRTATVTGELALNAAVASESGAYSGEITAKVLEGGVATNAAITFDTITADDGEFTVKMNIGETVAQDTKLTVELTAGTNKTSFDLYITPEKAYKVTFNGSDYYFDKTEDGEFKVEVENYFANCFDESGNLKDAGMGISNAPGALFGNDYVSFYDCNDAEAKLTTEQFKAIVKNAKVTIDFAGDILTDKVYIDGTKEYNMNPEGDEEEFSVASQCQITFFNPYNPAIGLLGFRGADTYSAPTKANLGLTDEEVEGLKTAKVIFSFDMKKSADKTSEGTDPTDPTDPSNQKDGDTTTEATSATVTAVTMTEPANTNVVVTASSEAVTATAVLKLDGQEIGLVATNDVTVVTTAAGVQVAVSTKAAVATKGATTATFEAVITVPANAATGVYPVNVKVATKGATTTFASVGTLTIDAAATAGGTPEEPPVAGKATKSIKLAVNKATIGVKEKLSVKITTKKTAAATAAKKVSISKNSKKAVATAKLSGKKLVITGKKAGKTTITVKSGKKTAKITVTVKKAPKKVSLKDGKKAAKKTVSLSAKTKKKAVSKTYTIVLPKNTASYDYTIKKSGKKAIIKKVALKQSKAGVTNKVVVTVKKGAKGSAKVVLVSKANKKAKATIKIKATK